MERWHVYLVYLLVLIVTVAPLSVSRTVPWLTQGTLYISLAGVIITFVVVLAMHQHFQPASYLLQPSSTVGSSGWPHRLAWILGAANSMYAYVGLDASMHISEEMKDAGKHIPRIMNLTMFIGALSALPLFTALMYLIDDPDKVANSSLPSLEAYMQATGSRAAAYVLQVWMTVVYVCK